MSAVFVATGVSSPFYVTTSSDGASWSATGTNVGAASLLWVEELGMMFSGGTSGVFFSSVDGITWTDRATEFADAGFGANTILDLCWSPELGLLLATGTSGKVASSPDGLTWTPVTVSGMHASQQLFASAWSASLGLFCIAGGTLGQPLDTWTSPDGATWTRRTSVLPNSCYSMAWSPTQALFMAVGFGGKVSTSPDGVAWTDRSVSFGSSQINDVIWVGGSVGRFVAGGADGKIGSSVNGSAWNQHTTGLGTSTVYALAYSEDLALIAAAAGDAKIVTSPTLATWTLRTSGFDGTDDVRMIAARSQNTAPNAPTLVAPINASSINAELSARFEWDFDDDDTADSQSKYDLRYRLVGAGTWTDVTATTTDEFRDFAASTFAAGNYEWQVRTYDAVGAASAYSASAFFTAATTPPTPTITAPADESIIGITPFTVTWSAPDQQAYQIRTVADSGGTPNTGVVYTDTGTVTSTGARSAAVAFAVTGRTEHVQVRIRHLGLWSEWASHEVDVDYVDPATPTVALAASSVTGTITLTVTHPSATGDQPDVVTWDVHVRVAAGGRADLERPVGGDGIRIAADIPAATTTFVDRAVASGVDYEYRVRAVGDNGVSVYSDWEG